MDDGRSGRILRNARCGPGDYTEAITAAFRRKARMVHPDVPGTGDAAAFIRVKQAYDLLGDAYRRAAYDRSARAVVPVSHDAPLEEEPGPDCLACRTCRSRYGQASAACLCRGSRGSGSVQPAPPDATATGAGHRADRTRSARGPASAARASAYDHRRYNHPLRAACGG